MMRKQQAQHILMVLVMLGMGLVIKPVEAQTVVEKLSSSKDFVNSMEDFPKTIHSADLKTFQDTIKLTKPDKLMLDNTGIKAKIHINTIAPGSVIQQISKDFAADLIQNYGYYHQHQDVLHYVNLVGHYLIADLPLTKQYRFGILDIDNVRTFSTPSGHIFVTRGLLENITTEAELAYALTREIAAVEHDYLLQSILSSVENIFRFEKLAEVLNKTNNLDETVESLKRKNPTSYNSNIFDTVNYFTSSSYSSLMDDPTHLMQLIVKELREHKYSKEYIDSLDKLGMDYCVLAGYDLEGIKNLITLYGKHGFGFDPTSRILAIENRALFFKGREGIIIRKRGKLAKERYISSVLVKLRPDDYLGYKDKIIGFIKGQY